MTIFYEGEHVEWAGGSFKAEGHIIALGSNSAHVKWATGPQAKQTTLTDLFDIEPVVAVKTEEDPLHLTAVRQAYDDEKEVGVLNFLASNNYLDTWQKIARDVIAYTEDRIKADASMDLPLEQLATQEFSSVVRSAAQVLLRDAFSDQE